MILALASVYLFSAALLLLYVVRHRHDAAQRRGRNRSWSHAATTLEDARRRGRGGRQPGAARADGLATAEEKSCDGA